MPSRRAVSIRLPPHRRASRGSRGIRCIWTMLPSVSPWLRRRAGSGRATPGGRRSRWLGRDRVAGGEQQRALDDVFELADIARPVVRHQRVDRVRVGIHGTTGAIAGVAQDHRGGERGDVAAGARRAGWSSAGRPTGDSKGRRGSGRRRLPRLQVAVGAGDRRGRRSCSAVVAPIGTTSRSCSARSSLAWRSSGISAISSSSNVPPFGGAEEALATGGGAGEGALLMAEQHRLEHRLGKRGAIDRDERPVAARTSQVDACARALPCRCRSGPLISTRDVRRGDALGEREQRETLRIGGGRRAGAARQRAGRSRSPIAASSVTEGEAGGIAVAAAPLRSGRSPRTSVRAAAGAARPRQQGKDRCADARRLRASRSRSPAHAATRPAHISVAAQPPTERSIALAIPPCSGFHGANDG